ncbi:hydroxymethylglutaryl-CoA lyase [Rhodoblastus sp. 17X3]|uniref:hydroxymethylglutaryl-CoA lyase n=1 Tax=Rhodoblastus sp. 17X3 TaxID=3047026 RepID=UPI0024B69CF4|nr:hydroxymethylglutaryl-CoA lyase [Rhodoblastus sp. 17X3]MDI9849658.1 hydroxymethylglutaryl-CoA lyase [Rhodoblastus sp. 17X3]
MTLPKAVKIVEVGPRDGLQNESAFVASSIKIELIERLATAGCRHIEATSFVSPRKIPQLADAAEVMRAIRRAPEVTYSALTPNLKGFEAAMDAGANEIAVFAAASETFSRKNINCSTEESLTRFEPVLDAAKRAGVRARAYVSCALGCPYEGEIAPAAVTRVAERLFNQGCYEISLGDTIGVGTPLAAKRMIEAVAEKIPLENLAGHFHDTYGMAAANVWAALEMGMAVFDSSVGGLGGCPYAPGAAGNLATEDLAWLMQGSGVETGLDLPKLVDCANWISGVLGREAVSRVARALKKL